MPKPHTVRREARRAARWEARGAAVAAVLTLGDRPPPAAVRSDEARAAYRAELMRIAELLNYRDPRGGRTRVRTHCLTLASLGRPWPERCRMADPKMRSKTG